MSTPKGVMLKTLEAEDCTYEIKGVKYLGIQFTFAVSTPERIATDLEEVKELVHNSPEKIYTAFLGPITQYLNHLEKD